MASGNLIFLLGQVRGFVEGDFQQGEEPLAVVVVRTAPSQEGGHHWVLVPAATAARLRETWEASDGPVEVWVLGEVRQETARTLVRAVRLDRVS